MIDKALTPEQRAQLDGKSPATVEETPEAEPPNIVSESALYGVNGNPEQQVDLTEKIQQRVDEGVYWFVASYQFAGRDPAVGIHKTTEIEYSLDGELKTVSLREAAEFDLLNPSTIGGSVPNAQEIPMAIEALGHVGGEKWETVL